MCHTQKSALRESHWIPDSVLAHQPWTTTDQDGFARGSWSMWTKYFYLKDNLKFWLIRSFVSSYQAELITCGKGTFLLSAMTRGRWNEASPPREQMPQNTFKEPRQVKRQKTFWSLVCVRGQTWAWRSTGGGARRLGLLHRRARGHTVTCVCTFISCFLEKTVLQGIVRLNSCFGVIIKHP